MSKPINSAARNQMSEFERQCYDWGWADSEERIIKLLEKHSPIDIYGGIYCRGCDENDYKKHLIALIKGEK
jgi:hypothetical protein